MGVQDAVVVVVLVVVIVEVTGGCVTGILVVVVVVVVAVEVTGGAVTVVVTVEGVGTVYIYSGSISGDGIKIILIIHIHTSKLLV